MFQLRFRKTGTFAALFFRKIFIFLFIRLAETLCGVFAGVFLQSLKPRQQGIMRKS